MDKLIIAAKRAFSSVTTPGMVGIFVKSLIISAIFLTLLVVGISYGASYLAEYWVGWYAKYIPWIAGIGSVFLAWLLFPGIMPLIISFFDESIIRNIETHEYPPALQGVDSSFWKELPHDIKFALKAIGLNIILIPLYFIPLINFFVFLSLNGYLLGNEFYLTVARRHVGLAEAVRLRKINAGVIFLGGLMLVFLSTIPVVNLFAPFWGVALMTHLYHSKAMANQVI